jgi:hypothetical protein
MKKKPQRLREFKNFSQEYHKDYSDKEYDILMKKRKEFEGMMGRYHKENSKKSKSSM